MRLHDAGVILVAVALLAGCGGGASSPEAPAQHDATPVRTSPVQMVTIAREVRAVGILAPRDEIRLAFKVGGVLDRVDVDVGDRVREGQVLAVLKRAEIDAAVSQAAEGVEKARRDLERARQLRVDEVATEEQVEDLTTAYSVARSNLQAAQFNARFARTTSRSASAALTTQPESVEPITSTVCPPCTSSSALASRCCTTPSAGASMRANRALNWAACRFERATL